MRRIIHLGRYSKEKIRGYIRKINISIYILLCVLLLIPFLNIKFFQKEDSKNQIIVIFQNNITDDYLHKSLQYLNKEIQIVNHIDDYALLHIKDKCKYQYILNSLKILSNVKLVEEDNQICNFSNDTFYNTQWAIDNPGYYSFISENNIIKKEGISDVDMDVLEAWDYMDEKSEEVVVAIVDTGVDYNHQDLSNNMWINKTEIPNDGIDNDENGYIDDINGWDFYNNDSTVCHYLNENTKKASPIDNDNHGTHVAGIIAAVGNNNEGIAGVASNINIKIMPLKVNGGPNGSGTISDAIEAIKYATKMGADICNISWGGSYNNEALNEVIKESDMLFIAAAGNGGNDNDIHPIYPASLQYDNIISVTNVNAYGELTDTSNYGAKSVDIAAPGEDIYSTTVGGYSYMSGSSMAAPYVTAVCALLYSYGDDIYPSNIKDILLNNIKPIISKKSLIKYPGIPSAYSVVLNKNSIINDNTKPHISLETVYNNKNIIIIINPYDKGSGIRTIKWLNHILDIKSFMHGTIGNSVVNNQVVLDKGGKYTFYISDYAGNEITATYKVIDDESSPSLFIKCKNRTVLIEAEDNLSGIKILKYMFGKRDSKYFIDKGYEIILNNQKGSFFAKYNGTYTIFTSDNRGNYTIKHILVNKE